MLVTSLTHGGKQDDVRLDRQTVDMLGALQSCKRGGQSKERTWLEFMIDATGRPSFDLRYDVSPLAAEELALSRRYLALTRGEKCP